MPARRSGPRNAPAAFGRGAVQARVAFTSAVGEIRVARILVITAVLVTAVVTAMYEPDSAALLLFGFGLIGLSFLFRRVNIVKTPLPTQRTRTLLAPSQRAGFLFRDALAVPNIPATAPRGDREAPALGQLIPIQTQLKPNSQRRYASVQAQTPQEPEESLAS